MARHNYVSVLALVRKEPKFKDTVDGRAGIVGLTTIMSGREYDKATSGYQLNSVSFCARTQEKEILDVMDVVETVRKPEDSFLETKTKDIYVDFMITIIAL